MKSLRIILLVLMVSSFCSNHAFSQAKENEKPKVEGNRWVFGGNISAQFGNTTFVGANPSVGYRLTNRLTAGAGGMYYYWDQRGFEGASIYGPTMYARMGIANNLLSEGDRLFAQTDFYYLNVPTYNLFDLPNTRTWVPQWFVGGGYYLQIGNNVYAGLTVQYDIIQDPNAFFGSTFIGGGISVGL